MMILSIIPILFSISSIIFINFYYGDTFISFKVFLLFLFIFIGWLFFSKIFEKIKLRHSLSLFLSIFLFFLLSYFNLIFIFTIIIFFLFTYFFKIRKNINIHLEHFNYRNFLLILGIFFLSWGVFSSILSYYQYSFLFIERLAASGHHLDNLFHSALTNIIKTYGVTSLGVHELTPLTNYYTLSNYLISAFSTIIEIEVFEFINYGVFTFFVPLLILSLTSLLYDLKFKLNNFDVLLIILIVLFGWFPTDIIESSLGRHVLPDFNHINSIVGFIIINFIFLLVHQIINLKIDDKKFYYLIIFFLWIILTKTKLPFAIGLSPGLIIFFIITCIGKSNLTKFFNIGIIFLIILLVLNFKQGGNIQYNPSIKDFGYFYYYYANGSILLITFLCLGPIIFLKNLSLQIVSLKSFLKNFSFEIFYFSSSFIFLIYSLFYRHTTTYAPIHYFQDFLIYVSAIYIVINYNFAKIKFLENKSFIFLFIIFLLILNSFSNISKKSHHASAAYLNLLMINNNTDLNYKKDSCYLRHYKKLGEKNKNFIEISKNIYIFHNLTCSFILRKYYKDEIEKTFNTNNGLKKFIKKILKINKEFSVKEKKKYLIFIDHNYYNILFKEFKSHKIQQFMQPIEFVVPAITGIAQLHGKRNKNRLPGYGSFIHDKLVVNNYNQMNKKNICDQPKDNKNKKIIYIDSNEQTIIDCK